MTPGAAADILSPVGELLWLNGRIVPASRATVPALDRACQIGFGLFEVTRGYGGRPFRLRRHLDRLRASARRFGLPMPFGRSAEADVRRLLRLNRVDDAYIRLVVTAGGPGIRPSAMIRAIRRPAVPADWYSKGAAIRLSSWVRDERAPLFGHKTLNYLENVLTQEASRARGFADTVFRSTTGRLLEGCASNLFLVIGGALHTPALGHILPGVTRQVVLEIARRLRIPVRERPIPERDLERAEEAFLTNALVEVLPVVRAGRRRIGSGRVGEVTQAVGRAYPETVSAEVGPASPRVRAPRR